MSDIDRASQAGVPLVKGGFADLWIENQRLKLELSAAQKDAERFDYMKKCRATVYCSISSPHHWVFVDERKPYVRRGIIGESPRVAIDAAIAAEKQT